MSDISVGKILREGPKFSIIMQSFLGDYPGSRTEPVKKFIRVCKSFQAQVYKNSELIIVSDNCMLTWEAYTEHFKDDSRIKFAFIDKSESELMYTENEGGLKYYRGLPRQVGLEMATGDWVTYIDSDDYLLPSHLLWMALQTSIKKDAKWMINKSWYDHATKVWPESEIMCQTDPSKEIKLDILGGELFNVAKSGTNAITMTPWLFSHVIDVNAKWEDTLFPLSEDVKFNRDVREQYPKGRIYDIPTYVRCHFSGEWDV